MRGAVTSEIRKIFTTRLWWGMALGMAGLAGLIALGFAALVGTDFGVYVSTNGGARWEVLGGNLPSTQVSDLQYHPVDQVLVISTYGRGMFAMDVSAIK